MTSMRHLFAKCSQVDDYINAAILSAIVAVTALQVLSRYVFNYSLGWTSELGGILLAWLVFLGAPSMLKRSSHMGISVLAGVLNTKSRRVLLILVEMASLVFYGVLFIGGLEFVKYGQFYATPAMELQGSQIYLVIPIAAVLLALRTLVRIRQLLQPTRPQWIGHEDHVD